MEYVIIMFFNWPIKMKNNILLDIFQNSKKLLTKDVKSQLNSFSNDFSILLKKDLSVFPNIPEKDVSFLNVDEYFIKLNDKYKIKHNFLYNNYSFCISKELWSVGYLSSYKEALYQKGKGFSKYKKIINCEFKQEVSKNAFFYINLICIKNKKFIDIHYLDNNKKTTSDFDFSENKSNFRLRYSLEDSKIDYLNSKTYLNDNKTNEKSIIDYNIFKEDIFNYVLLNSDLSMELIAEHLFLEMDVRLEYSDFIVQLIEFIKMVDSNIKSI